MIMKRSDIAFLIQLVNALEEAEVKLEQEYRNKNYEGFNKAKKFILQVNQKILEVIK